MRVVFLGDGVLWMVYARMAFGGWVSWTCKGYGCGGFLRRVSIYRLSRSIAVQVDRLLPTQDSLYHVRPLSAPVAPIREVAYPVYTCSAQTSSIVTHKRKVR